MKCNAAFYKQTKILKNVLTLSMIKNMTIPSHNFYEYMYCLEVNAKMKGALK